MDSKVKAKELVDKFSQVASFHDMSDVEEEAKFCAICCVGEILWFMEDADPQALSYELIGYRDFYREVLREINNL